MPWTAAVSWKQTRKELNRPRRGSRRQPQLLPLRTDKLSLNFATTAREIRFCGDVREVVDKVVHIRMFLRDADRYAIRFGE